MSSDDYGGVGRIGNADEEYLLLVVETPSLFARKLACSACTLFTAGISKNGSPLFSWKVAEGEACALFAVGFV
jgi:hypothetical protein